MKPKAVEKGIEEINKIFNNLEHSLSFKGICLQDLISVNEDCISTLQITAKATAKEIFEEIEEPLKVKSITEPNDELDALQERIKELKQKCGLSK